MSQPSFDVGFSHDRTTGKEEWLTPPEIIRSLGPFDLDPCAPSTARRPWPTATRHFAIEDNGLAQEWDGAVWLNPPYGNQTPKWLSRLADHGDGIALIYARTDAAIFHDWVWPAATAMLWLKGRIHFFTSQGARGGRAGAPSVLIAYGDRCADRLESADRAVTPGFFMRLRK